MLKKLLNGMLFGIWAWIMLSLFMVWIFLVKWAWQSSNPTAWLWDATNLYISWEDTLTKEKWNALVEKVNTNGSSSLWWEVVDLNDTTTGFDVLCQRRWIRNSPWNTTSSTPSGLRYAGVVSVNWNNMYFREGTTIYTVSKTLKSRMVAWPSWRQISKLEKNCN